MAREKQVRPLQGHRESLRYCPVSGYNHPDKMRAIEMAARKKSHTRQL